MEIDVGAEEQTVETVEVVASGDDVQIPASSAGLMDQHMIVTNPEGILVPTSEVQIESQTLPSQVLDTESSFSMPGMGVVTIPVEPTSPTQGIMLGTKRVHPDATPVTSVGLSSVSDLNPSPVLTTASGVNNSNGMFSEIPRKKSRNYLDSHKTIEKKRRDRINQCLESLKSLVPDCRQYGSKKLDKAEILEMSIEYIQKIQNQGGAGGRGNTTGLDLNLNQREWANDLTTWVIHNKLLFSGPSALDQFCQALLLHLQSMGSGNALASATSMLLNQANSSSEEDALLRQQTVNAQVTILQQLQQQLGSLGGKEEGGQLQQAQLTQLQALLLLQQHQQLQQQQQQQQQQQDVESQSQQQLQQLQQLQALLLQHIANENTPPNNNVDSAQKGEESSRPGKSSIVGEEQLPVVGMSESTSPLVSNTSGPGVELARSEELEPSVSTEETVYTSGIPGGLDDENLIQVSVSVTQTPGSAITNPASGQMWSSAGTRQSTSLLMLGGGSESEGEGPAPGGKSQLIENTIISPQEEEVELLTHQEQ